MEILCTLKCFLLGFISLAGSYRLKLYSGDESHTYSCNFQFENPIYIDCVCANGLWILYDSCGTENMTVAGHQDHCFETVDAPQISKGVQLLGSKEDLAVLETDGSVIKLTEQNAQDFFIDKQNVLVAGSDWTISDTSGGRICLAVPDSNSYCFFANLEENSWEIESVSKGCNDEYDYFVDPFKCYKVAEKSSGGCPDTGSKRRVKREDAAAAPPPPAGDGGNATDGITPDDEDYMAYNASLEAGNETDTSPISIASGIMDYMGKTLDQIMSLGAADPEESPANDTSNNPDINSRGGNPLNVTYTNPVYEYLEISKRITQKTCPPHYVKPEFLSLAVAAFINMQQVRFKFPEQSFRPSGFRRVLNYLRLCEEKAMPFNFSDPDCDGKVSGNYSAYGQDLELTITSELADFSRDPIVETVWKVFFNAHSFCYPYFNKTLDHHRFTTWMIPLFQNEINALWVSGNTTEKSLGGLFGNQIEVQGNLGYCVASSRLESKYPWDLPRPSQIAELGGASNKTDGNGTDAGGAPPAGGSRKKRETIILNYDLENDEEVKSGSCMESWRPSLCPKHVQSIIQSYID